MYQLWTFGENQKQLFYCLVRLVYVFLLIRETVIQTLSASGRADKNGRPLRISFVPWALKTDWCRWWCMNYVSNWEWWMFHCMLYIVKKCVFVFSGDMCLYHQKCICLYQQAMQLEYVLIIIGVYITRKCSSDPEIYWTC